MEWLCLPVGAAASLAAWSVVPGFAGALAVPLVRSALRARARRAAADRISAAVSVLCGTVAGDLRAGRPPHSALADAVHAAGWPGSAELGRIAGLLLSAARFGGDVPGALRAAARCGPGAQGLGAVAACWQVAVDGGAGLATALDRVAAALRSEADQREDLRAQLAGPRSTAVLLALLPVFGLVLGTGLGADPATVLLHTPAGFACLVAGAVLEWAGLAWTARIIRAAEGAPRGDRWDGPTRSAVGKPASEGGES
jgi:tight adherence protein B